MRNFFVLGITMLVLLLISCRQKTEYQYAEGKIYGTYYHISYEAAKDLQAEIQEQLERVNASLSMFNLNSTIAHLNGGSSDSTDILFRRMLNEAQKVYRTTDGAFDITVAPLVNAWGFGVEKQVFPDSSRIDSLLVLVGMDKLELVNDRLVKKYPGMKMDASSIAKGLGVDLMAEYFDKEGIQNYMVEVGGEVRVKGQSDKKRPWRIGIDCPEDDASAGDRQLQAVLQLTSGALATSGNYRNFYIHEGKKYAHTINPKTGFPVQTEIVSSSVYAGNCMEADAYATAFMVLGLEKAQRILEQNPEIEGYLIYQEGDSLKTWFSDGLKKMLSTESK